MVCRLALRPHSGLSSLFMSSKSRFMLVCLIVLLAAALRLVFFHQFWRSDFFDCPVLDMRTYIQQAQCIAKDGLRGLGVIWRPPLYPALLSLSIKYTNGNVLPAMILQLLLSSLSAGLVYLVARRFAPDGIALAAAALYAIHWIAIFFSALFLGTSLFIFLLLLALWLLLVSDATRAAPLILAGLAAGLSALVRTEILPCVLAWAAWIAWRKRFANAALFFIAVALPILPVAIHNYRVTGQFVPVTAIGGYNFFVGNNAQADGKTVWASKEALEKLDVSEELPPLDNQSRYLNAALGDILNNPARFAGLILKKTYYLLNAYEISSNTDIYYADFRHEPDVGCSRPVFFRDFASLISDRLSVRNIQPPSRGPGFSVGDPVRACPPGFFHHRAIPVAADPDSLYLHGARRIGDLERTEKSADERTHDVVYADILLRPLQHTVVRRGRPERQP